MRLATIDPEQLAAWLCRTVSIEGAVVELHVMARHWELRCWGLPPFVIEWDDRAPMTCGRMRGSAQS